jgi:hypothetical protein
MEGLPIMGGHLDVSVWWRLFNRSSHQELKEKGIWGLGNNEE